MRIKWIIMLVLISTAALFAQEEEKKDALQLYRDKAYAESVEVCLAELSEYGPDETTRIMDAYTVLCWSLMGMKDYNRVIQYGKEALTHYRYDNRIIFSLGEAYYYKGSLITALEYFQQYTLLNPTGGGIRTAYYFMGEIFLRLEEYAHADIAFSTALYHSPNVAQWWVRLGYAREQIEDFDNAKVAYQKALELQPGQADATAGLERVERNR